MKTDNNNEIRLEHLATSKQPIFNGTTFPRLVKTHNLDNTKTNLKKVRYENSGSSGYEQDLELLDYVNDHKLL
jgi:hypothetical protein